LSLPRSFRKPVAEITAVLARGDFDALEADGRAGRVGADGLRQAVAEYGRTLIELPDAAYELADAGPVSTEPGQWWVVVPMWTAEEGRSDLSLELSAIPSGDGHRFEIDDLHVL
jgi:hypothetical protein